MTGKSPTDRSPSIEELPESLRKAIVKLMAREDLDKAEAYERAAVLLDVNSAEFERRVDVEANTRYKSRHLVELNKVRAGWQKNLERVSNEKYGQGWNESQELIREFEMFWEVPCSACGKPMKFSSNDAYFAESYEVLKRAFANWHHKTCM